MLELTLSDILRPSDMGALEKTGYAVGEMRISGVSMHVVVIRVIVMRVTMGGVGGEEIWLELADVVPTSAHSDVDAIIALMGDGAGRPKLAAHKGHHYLIGCAPCSN